MTMALLVAVFLAVLQFAYAVHVRSTLTLGASEGARVGARVGAHEADAVARTREFVTNSLSTGMARDISAAREGSGGASVMRVSVTAPIPVLGPFGVGLTMHTSARAVIEERP